MTSPRKETKTQGGGTRRDFLARTAAAGAASLLAAPYVIADNVKGANERIGIGFIGTGNRAACHIGIINELRKQGLVEPVAVCDVYRHRLAAVSRATGGTKMYMEHEALLADPRVDVVCIAAPDRQHPLLSIDALNAGKDVYCEKPLTHWAQFELAKKVEEAATKNKRLIQVGTQHMADDNYPHIIELIRGGIIGKPVHVMCHFFRRGDWGERMPITEPNAKAGPDLLWDRWLGDAPKQPFDLSRFFQWRMYWDYAGGPATDLLVHTFTPIACILELGYPERVFGGGGMFEFTKPLPYQREVSDQCNIIADYPGGPSVVFASSLSNHVPADTYIRGTDGIIMWGMLQGGKDYGVRIVPFGSGKKEIHLPWKGQGDVTKLWLDLLDCVRTRRQTKCNIAMSVRVQAPLSMGVLSCRESKVAKFDKVTQQIVLV